MLLGPRLTRHRGLSPAPEVPHGHHDLVRALVLVTPVLSTTERLALAGFLAGYSGLTRQALELDLCQYATWCQQHQLRLFAARRADIEDFARDLEARGRARATISRRLCTIAGLCRFAVEEDPRSLAGGACAPAAPGL